MNQPAKVWPLFQHQPDPRMRSYLIHRLSPLGVESGMILKRLEDEPDVTIRRALVLSLGEYSEKGLSSDTRKVLVPKLKDIYRTADDPGLHAAAEWLLRQWKQEAWLNQVNDEWAKDKAQRTKRQHDIQKFISRDKEKTSPKWYVNGQSQTMIVIPGPTEFVMGSPPTEADRKIDETQHIRRIGRTFAIAAKSVTVGQYRRFYKDYQTGADVFASRPVLPAVGVSWYAAAAYCQWLSKEEGIPQEQWCYEINRNEIKLKANYLSLNGYRLPTEAEIEYAIRAGTVTSRYFGETDELLPKYAWYKNNAQERTWPVGLLKPNDLGLFDTLGNVWTWCQEGYRPYPQSSAKNTKSTLEDMAVIDDKEDELSVPITRVRMLRGSRFFDLTAFVRSACRCSLVPPDSYLGIGFRVARTLPPTP